MAELFYLADQYLIMKVQDTLVAEVSSREIVSEELLVFAKGAGENLHMEKFSSSLYVTCVNFVRENMDKVLEIFLLCYEGIWCNFFQNHSGREKSKKYLNGFDSIVNLPS